MPEFAASAGISGPAVIGRREVKDAIDEQARGDLMLTAVPAGPGVKRLGPFERKVLQFELLISLRGLKRRAE